MTVELLDKSNENYNNKRGGAEYDSRLPEMLNMVNGMFPNIPNYNYPSQNEMPDLEGYNVHYNEAEFNAFAQILNQPQVVNQNTMVR